MTLRDYVRHAYRAALPLLYARSNFKLFLRGPLESWDRRVQQLASMTDYFSSFVRPVPIRAPFGKSMLVVAPHQDDETIGCGGALALQIRSGKSAYIVILQDGADEFEEIGMAREDLCALRNEESRRAAALLAVEPPRFLGHSDLAAAAQEATEQLRAIIIERKVDAVFIPFMLDSHYDHRTANNILANALKTVDWNVRVFGYEVWGLCIPNVIVVIDDVIQLKLDMLSCFDYANKAVDYVHTTKGLNMYRSRLLGAGECQYAECFFEIPAHEYIQVVERVRATDK